MKLNYFANCQSFNEVKAEYKKLALKHHPDLFQNVEEKAANEKIMKEINSEFDFLSKNPEKVSAKNTEKETKDGADFEKFKDIINQMIAAGLINNPVLTVELCGSWLWVSGRTWEYAGKFRELGFNWCKGKKMWSWKSTEDKRGFYRGKNTIDEIRSKYGSQAVGHKTYQLARA